MNAKKCPMCKIRIPNKIKVCPVCGTEFTKFQYFRMNYLSKCILGVLAVAFVYHSIVVISFNRKIRSYVENPPENMQKIEDLKNRYEKLDAVQKFFVHRSELEMVEKDFVDDSKKIVVENHRCSMFFEDGKQDGTYTGEIYESIPEGDGKFTYYNKEGVLCVYEGEFSNGEMTGIGVLTFEDGTKYAGRFRSGVLNGNATIYNPEGYIIKKGDFVAGKLNGIGTIYDPYGIEIYSGRFVADIPTKREYKDVCELTTFAQIEADTESFVNKNLAIKGVVTDVVIQEDMTVLYVISIAGNRNKNICLNYIGESGVNIRQGDNKTFYGYCEGYRTFVGNSGENYGGMFIKTYHFD